MRVRSYVRVYHNNFAVCSITCGITVVVVYALLFTNRKPGAYVMVVLISRMFCRAGGTLGGYLGDVCRLVCVIVR